jgi:predicted transcriptional regulator
MAQIRDDKLLLKMALVLKDLRHDMGVSQEEVYNDTNIHIGRIEAGALNPTVSTLSALLRYFNIKMSDFFSLVESKRV